MEVLNTRNNKISFMDKLQKHRVMFQCDIMWEIEKKGETSKWNKSLILMYAFIQRITAEICKKVKVYNII